jgi:hypothetical protein
LGKSLAKCQSCRIFVSEIKTQTKTLSKHQNFSTMKTYKTNQFLVGFICRNTIIKNNLVGCTAGYSIYSPNIVDVYDGNGNQLPITLVKVGLKYKIVKK